MKFCIIYLYHNMKIDFYYLLHIIILKIINTNRNKVLIINIYFELPIISKSLHFYIFSVIMNDILIMLIIFEINSFMNIWNLVF